MNKAFPSAAGDDYGVQGASLRGQHSPPATLAQKEKYQKTNVKQTEVQGP